MGKLKLGPSTCGFRPMPDHHGCGRAWERAVEVRKRMAKIEIGNRGQLPSFGGRFSTYKGTEKGGDYHGKVLWR